MNRNTCFLTIFLILLSTLLFAQKEKYCGTVDIENAYDKSRINTEETERLVDLYYHQLLSKGVIADDFNIPIQFHVTRSTQGDDPAVSDEVLISMLSYLNQAYGAINVTFSTCGTSYIDNTFWNNNFDKDSHDGLLNAYDHLYVLNLYVVGNMSDLNGYAKFPEDQIDRVVVESENALTTTVIHEVGHYFSLRHTESTSRGVELVDGSNCEVSGDLICDTPADPGERDYYSNCQYIGTVTDPNGMSYSPDGFNYMSRGQGECRSRFSLMQLSRMAVSLLMDRYYLVSCSGSEPAITCDDTIQSFPYSESFEDFLGSPEWKQDLDDDFGWIWGADTPSSSTGPDEAQEGRFFLYTEASDYQNMDAALISPCFDFQDKGTAHLSFSYHMYGVDIGKLEVQIKEPLADAWATIWVQEGDKGNQWNEATVDLGDYTDAIVHVRFLARTRGDSKGDIAIDQVLVDAGVITDTENTTQDKMELTLYPNPATETLTITYLNQMERRSRLIVTSIDGKVMHDELIQSLEKSEKYQFDVSVWVAGAYLVRIIAEEWQQSRVFMVQ